MPVLRHFVHPGYWEGLGVIPVVMLAEIFMGIYFNLSFWYKLTDQTWWGAVMSAAGTAVMIVFNVLFVPEYGYWACAWGGFAGYGTAMLLSWFIGQKKFPIPYDLQSIFTFFVVAGAYFFIYAEIQKAGAAVWVLLTAGTLLLLSYAYLVFRMIKHK